MQPGWVGRFRHRVRRRLRHDEERGAVLVEAAIIIPVIVFLTFGAIEFGFAFNEQGTTRAATRTAARSASALPKRDWITMSDTAANVLSGSMNNLANGRPELALVYDVSRYPTPPSALADCAIDCAAFTWNAVTERFVRDTSVGNDWLPAEREACAPTADSVGVFLQIDHGWLTGLPFTPGADGVTLRSRTTMSLEPDVTLSCAATIP